MHELLGWVQIGGEDGREEVVGWGSWIDRTTSLSFSSTSPLPVNSNVCVCVYQKEGRRREKDGQQGKARQTGFSPRDLNTTHTHTTHTPLPLLFALDGL
jgi:hypothetical protein